jgi:hypothetical protein
MSSILRRPSRSGDEFALPYQHIGIRGINTLVDIFHVMKFDPIRVSNAEPQQLRKKGKFILQLARQDKARQDKARLD